MEFTTEEIDMFQAMLKKAQDYALLKADVCRPEFRKAFGAMMKARREDAGIGLREMSNILDVAPSYVCDFEAGRRSWDFPRINKYYNSCMRAKAAS